jgi:SAM-dependent methyltransferase
VPSLARDIAYNLVLALPPARRYRERKAKGYDAGKDAVEYVRGVFERHYSAAGRPTSGAALEIGPGGNLAVALQFLAAGLERVTCIDTTGYVRDTEDLNRELVGDRVDLLARIDYRVPDAIETTSMPSATFDVVYSHATLEHVRSPEQTARQIARLLKPNGVTTHQVDLRDHRDFSKPHDFLRYSNRVWELAFSNHSYVNRWRASDWRRVFEDHGLEVEIEATESVPLPDMARLSRTFARKAPEDLATVGVFLTARKPS